MIGIKDKFHSPFSRNTPHGKIVDGTSTICEKGVVHVIASLSLDNVLFVLKFPVSLLSINKLTTQNHYCAIFTPTHCVFQDVQTGMRISLGRERAAASTTWMLVHFTPI